MIDDNRPSPDTLLAEAQSEQRGKLKIFLGAAPGVGKTYAMLGATKTRLAEGIDAVIGIVETHRRSETESLAQGIEAIPRRKVDYRGLSFDEMDLDAILARKPQLVLVDELAHTNIPGVRHRKRYQDVQEILEAGIDVYSTLNIQHIESLNDIVARITGVTVRETVPDTLVQMAHAIELIDLPPEELLKRLAEGKVYIPEQARLAINRFFTPGNLTALRELALRQAAARVDEDMASYMRRHAIAGPWPTSSRILVCITGDKQAASLVRTARRTAERRQAPWMVLYVETSRHTQLSEAARMDIAQALEMGQNMGAETLTVTSENVTSEVLRIAREHNVSTIIIGKSVRTWASRLIRPSVAAEILSRCDGFDVLLVNNTEARKNISEPRYATASRFDATPDWMALARGGFIIFISTLVASLSSRMVSTAFLPFIYLVAILLIVADAGLVIALAASVLSAIALDLIISAPALTLIPKSSDDLVLLLFFLTISISISFIGDRLHRQIRSTQRNAERTQTLYDFTRSIAAAATLDDVVRITVGRLATTLGAQVTLLMPRHEHLESMMAMPADLQLDTASNAAMDWAWRHGKPAGFKSDTLPAAAFYGLPLRSSTSTLGVIALRRDDGSALTLDQMHFLNSLCYQASSAIERAQLVSDVTQARLQTESEKLRTNLLSSVSYDLRAPLDNIIALTRQLNKDENTSDGSDQQRMLLSIETEAERLDRFVQNLLDMTELTTGHVRLNRKPLKLREVIDKALKRLARQVAGRTMLVHIPSDLPHVYGDEAALLRVFVNVVENACAYSPQDRPVMITASLDKDEIIVTITDQGPGIPERERELVFDMFYRIKSGATAHTSVGGVGLGLSICRGFIEAHQGSIKARTGDQGIGTSIVIRLPVASPDDLV